MPIATGVAKVVAYKLETTYGTAAIGTGGQVLRRVSSDLSLSKQTYQSNEIRTDQQIADFRHGVRSVDGTISGELSPRAYADFIAAALRRNWTTGASAASVSVTIAGTGPTYTITRAAGSYLTDGFKIGDVIRLTVGTLNAANINKNLFITALTGTVATVRVLNGTAMVAEGPITGTTVSVVGKKTFAPVSGHTNQSFTIEHWFPEAPASEAHTGCQPTSIDMSLPATGLATIGIGFVGQNIVTSTTQQMTSPTAAPTQGVCASVNGVLSVGGNVIATVTGMTINVASDRTGDAVVGSNVIPSRYPGRISVSGQLTAYFEDVTLRDAFINESEVAVLLALTSDNTATSEVLSIALPRVKLGGASKDDSTGGIVQTIPFQALYNSAGGTGIATEQTTISIQDSAAP